MLNEQQQLSKAIQLASTIHEDQFDKGGKPYILHPIHLMNQLLFDTQLATIAVLHDVVEDSDGIVNIGDLASNGFSERVCETLSLLTRDHDEDYLTSYIKRICMDYDAIRVKRKDLEHNSDITRLKGVTDKDLERIGKYHVAFTMLGEAKKEFEK